MGVFQSYEHCEWSATVLQYSNVGCALFEPQTEQLPLCVYVVDDDNICTVNHDLMTCMQHVTSALKYAFLFGEGMYVV